MFGVKIDGAEDYSIVPFADMFNYKYLAQMTYWSFSEKYKAFVILANHCIKAQEEIFVYYGNKTNASFFQFYGFTVDHNDNDEIYLEASLNLSDDLYKEKSEMIDNKITQSFKLSARTIYNRFDQLMSFLRFLTFKGNSEELTKVYWHNLDS